MAKKDKKQEHYSAKQITSLTPRQHLIKRMNLTFSQETGDEFHPFSSQKSISVREVLDNSTTEVLKGYGSRVLLHFYKDGSVLVQDDGRGLPIDTTKNSLGELVSGFIITMGTLQSGENLGDNESDGKATNQNGLGGSAVNFLSKRMDIKVYRDKKEYSLSFKNGDPGFFKGDLPEDEFEPITDLTYIKESKDTRSKEEQKKFPKGTAIKFWLNEKVYSSPYPIDIEDMITRIRGNAFLLPNNTFEVINEFKTLEDGSYQHEIYNFEIGIPQLVELNQTGESITPVIHNNSVGEYIEKNVPVHDSKTNTIQHKNVTRTVDIEYAFSYSNNYSYSTDSYVNTIRTRLGGVHVKAFEEALVTVFNEKFSSMKSILTQKDPIPIIDDYREGLTSVISVYVSEPQYTSQIKEELGGNIVKRSIKEAIIKDLKEFVNTNKNQPIIKIIGEKVVQAAKNRQHKKDIQELKREQNRLTSSTSLPIKLVDCEITHSEHSELYIAEGDSALTGLKEARYAKYQAILPIRGKLINAIKESTKKLFANQEVKDIIRCLDCGVGDDFDIDKARYSRIIIGTDADVDGGQISSLIALFIYKTFPDFVKEGRLYQMNTPLFVLHEKKKGVYHYCFNYEEYKEIYNEHKDKIARVVRNKGLGESGKNVLRDTGMNPKTRVLTQISVEDIEQTEKWFNIAMGTEVSIRKDWIENNPIDEIEE